MMQHRPTQAEAMVHGWCPSAWRPMMAGDGLLVRVRPFAGRMTAAQTSGLCDLARQYGNGAIDLTNRAGLQLRGVREEGLAPLLERLVTLGLVAADPAAEARPVLIVAPDWTAGDVTDRIARSLYARLGELPELPGKTGFAVDLSGAPILSTTPADFRLERGESGGMILRADGRPMGVPVEEADAVDRLLALARWFAASGGRESGRMARHKADLPPDLMGTQIPAAPRSPTMGATPTDCTYGAPFGRMEAGDLAVLLSHSGATALRVSPWRRIILEGAGEVVVPGFTLDPDDSLLTAYACVGAPACPQAFAETRDLARQLAPHVAGSLHISGCAKGCACPSPAHVVLTGRADGFDLGFDGRAGDPPRHSGLTPQQIISLLGAS